MYFHKSKIYCKFAVNFGFMEIIQRPHYLEKLIKRQNNGDIKVITGIRRCGKSWLLSKLYSQFLIGNGVPKEQIIDISLDMEEEGLPDLRAKEEFKKYVYGKIQSETLPYYIFIDEVQLLEDFERVINGLNNRENVDLYVTGSNSKFLSSDIRTIFRGRGDEVRVHPFSFKEFCTNRTEPISTLWKEFYTFGGMPGLTLRKTEEQKASYLKRLWDKTYVDDIVERNKVRNVPALEAIIDGLCSAISSLTNIDKIRNTLQSVSHIKTDAETISKYIGFVENAFLLSQALRYNIKGKRYYESIKKYYIEDVGLRNARLNFRQQEITHIMENVIYNELIIRDYLVDVGIVESRETIDGKLQYRQHEVDFIATNGMKKYYIQSAFALPDEAKRQQELASLLRIDDSFIKIVITADDIATYIDDHGIVFMGLFQFLTNQDVLE